MGGGVCRVEPSPLRLLSVGCRRLSFHLDGTRVLNRIIMSLVARTSLNCKLFYTRFSRLLRRSQPLPLFVLPRVVVGFHFNLI